MLGNWEIQWNDNKITIQNDSAKEKWTYDLTTTPCSNCGKSLMRGTICWDSRRHENLKLAEKVFSMGSYYSQYKIRNQSDSDILTQHIWNLKGDYDYAKPIGEAMVLTMINKCPEMLNAHFIIPVPSYGTNLNHATALGQIISDYLQNKSKLRIPLIHAISKIKDIKLHNISSGDKRQEEVEGMFEAEKNVDIIGKDIILVDDLLTTGATKSECIKILKIMGVRKIWVFVAATT